MSKGREQLMSVLEEEMKANLVQLIETKIWNIYRGVFVNRLERILGEMLGGYCLTTNSGTTAIELALRAAGIAGEVVIPCSTFVATVQAAMMMGASPRLSAVDIETYNLSKGELERVVTPRTSAAIAVHLFGNPSHIDELEDYCRHAGLVLIEDCAQSFGARLGTRPVGTFGTAGAFSFNICKHVTCGEGGALVTKDREIHLTAKAIRHAGLRPTVSGEYHAHEVGSKYLMTEFQAAVLLPQVEHWSELELLRRKQADLACALLASFEGCTLQACLDGAVHSWQRVACLSDSGDRADGYLARYPVLERFYPLPLTEEPVVRARCEFTNEVGQFTRDFWNRSFGITLKPFHDKLGEISSALGKPQV